VVSVNGLRGKSSTPSTSTSPGRRILIGNLERKSGVFFCRCREKTKLIGTLVRVRGPTSGPKGNATLYALEVRDDMLLAEGEKRLAGEDGGEDVGVHGESRELTEDVVERVFEDFESSGAEPSEVEEAEGSRAGGSDGDGESGIVVSSIEVGTADSPITEVGESSIGVLSSVIDTAEDEPGRSSDSSAASDVLEAVVEIDIEGRALDRVGDFDGVDMCIDLRDFLEDEDLRGIE
jgi:hypothetical protein